MSISEQTKTSTLNNTRKNHTYKVSIIVPCYNTKPWLDECLQSLVDQTLQDIEIICVNDGSTDGTGKRLDEWQAQYPDKIKVTHQKNGGLSNARNTGMKIAQGECIGFVDSDDFVDVSMYDKLYRVIENNNAEVVMSDCIEFINKKPTVTYKHNLVESKKDNVLAIFFEDKKAIWTGLYKYNFLQQNNIKFVDNLYYAEDIAFLYDVVIHTPILFSLPEITYYYRRQRTGQLTSTICKKLHLLFEMFNYLEIRQKNNPNVAFVEEMNEILLKEKSRLIFNYMARIDKKYKIDFACKSAISLFRNSGIIKIYKYTLFRKRNKKIHYLLAPFLLVLMHLYYLYNKVFLKSWL